MSIRLIISDVDGCMSPEESVSWEFEPFAEFCRRSRLASEGKSTLAPMTLCTGRPQPYVEALMKVLDIRYPAVCENGAVIYDLPTNEASYAPGVTAQKIHHLRDVRCFIEDHILPRHPKAIIQFGKEAQLSVYSHDPSIFPEIQGQLGDFLKAHSGPELIITASHFYLNISLAGANKGSAIRHIMQELRLTRDEVAGIGDTVGDLPLRKEVAFFACPANATADVKAVADYVSPLPTIRGMLDILDHPRLQRKP